MAWETTKEGYKIQVDSKGDVIPYDKFKAMDFDINGNVTPVEYDAYMRGKRKSTKDTKYGRYYKQFIAEEKITDAAVADTAALSASTFLSTDQIVANALIVHETKKEEDASALLAKIQGIKTKADAANNTYYKKTKPAKEKTATLTDDLKAVNATIKIIEGKISELRAVRTSWDAKNYKVTKDTELTAEEDRLVDQLTALQEERSGIQDDIDDSNTETTAVTSTTKAAVTGGGTTSNTPAVTKGLAVAPAPLATTASSAPTMGIASLANSTSAATTAKPTTSRPPKNLPITYNVAVLSGAYFSMNKDYLKETTFRGNRPAVVTQASQLWNAAATSKGMIVMTNPVPNSISSQGFGTSNKADGAAIQALQQKWVKYGFQFLYNPASVSMGFATAPDTDIGLQTSGQEAFNLMGTAGSFSTVSFQIILNRMFDMRYFDKRGQMSAEGKSQYGVHQPTANELVDIYNKGTMYDVEFLMRTLLGYTLNTYLRGNTADIGYLGAFPVELHLGKSMRYWGTIASFNVNHTIFNEKMIPIFSSIDITFNRLVDPPNVVSSSIATRGI